MNTKHISLAALAIVAVLAGCTKNPIETPSDSNRFADLELTSVNSVQTKAAIDGTTFPTDGEIGLFLFEDENATEPYGEGGYTNVKYSYNSTKGKWTASPSIKVGSTPGYLYGYYPYNSASTDVKAIPVVSSLNGDDVMYATSQTVTDKTASQTAITMNHALARVAVTVVNKGYTGAAKLSSIKFAGAETSAAGTLNALDGSITATKADVTLDVPAASQDITAAGTTYDCLLVPSDKVSGRQAVSLTLTIDGEAKTANLSDDNGVIIAQNTKSNITITLSNSGISVQTVSVEDWKVVEVGGHKVTIQLADDVIPHDLFFETFIADNSVIVNAWSKSSKHLKCTMPDGEFCTSQSQERGPVLYNQYGTAIGYKYYIFSFIISDISENTTATIGYANPVSSIAISPADSPCRVTIVGGDLYEGELVRLVPNASYAYGISSWNDQNDNVLCDGYDYTVRLSQDIQITACFKENLILDGIFTVDSSGKKVRFTRGNLCGGVMVDGHQYDFAKKFDDNYFSHFFWCDEYTKALKKVYNTHYDGQAPFFTEKEDFRINGLKETDCFVLPDWTFLLGGRIGISAVNGTENARFFKGCVQTEEGGAVNGLFIFPDSFTWPASVETQPAEINNESAGYDNTYTYNDFKRLQDAGIVFLPASGYREGSPERSFPEKVLYAGYEGYYWSSSDHYESRAMLMNFGPERITTSTDSPRWYSCAVRLVTEVK